MLFAAVFFVHYAAVRGMLMLFQSADQIVPIGSPALRAVDMRFAFLQPAEGDVRKVTFIGVDMLFVFFQAAEGHVGQIAFIAVGVSLVLRKTAGEDLPAAVLGMGMLLKPADGRGFLGDPRLCHQEKHGKRHNKPAYTEGHSAVSPAPKSAE